MFKAAVILILVTCAVGVTLGTAFTETMVISQFTRLLTTGR